MIKPGKSVLWNAGAHSKIVLQNERIQTATYIIAFKAVFAQKFFVLVVSAIVHVGCIGFSAVGAPLAIVPLKLLHAHQSFVSTDFF